MNRMKIYTYLIIIALLLGFSLLSAQSIKVDNLGNYQRLVLYLNGDYINFPNGINISKNGIAITIENEDEQVVYRDFRDIIIHDDNFRKRETFISIYNTTLSKGNYTLYFNFFNDALGNRFKDSVSFKINSSVDYVAPIAVNPFTMQIVDDIKQYGSLQELVFYFAFKFTPDAISLQCNDSLSIDIESDTLIVYSPKKEIRQQLNPSSHFVFNLKGQTTRLTLGSKQVEVLYSGLYSWKHKLAQLRYITTQNQWRHLRKLKKDNEIEAGINKFWDAYSETDAGPESMRSTFYKRVIEADNRFSFRKYKKGWMTDRGRILIKYGEPDEILKEALPIGTKPYIIWYYYNINKNFLFQDIKGFGDYELQNTQDEY